MLRTQAVLLLLLSSGYAQAAKYYCLLFSHDSKLPIPCYSHVFGTFLKIEDEKIAEEVTISWRPYGSWHIFDKPKPGYNMTLKESLDLAKSENRVVCLYGPYEINEEFYQKAAFRYKELPDKYKYKALDCWSRHHGDPAINCHHALSDLTGGELRTYCRYGKLAIYSVKRHFEKEYSLQPVEEADNIVGLLDIGAYNVRNRHLSCFSSFTAKLRSYVRR